MNEHFCLVLLSNSSPHIFSENKTTSFKVQLPHLLELDVTKWGVALLEVQFPNNFYTIREGHNIVIKQYISPSTDEPNSVYNNTETNIKKEELGKIKSTALEQDYVYQESMEVLPHIYGSIEQVLSQR